MILKSPAFKNNESIPKKHTGFGADLSPELIIENIPDNTKSFVIILDDLDVPFIGCFTHWIAWNICNVNVIPEDLPKGQKIFEPIQMCQGKAWGKHCYRGPKQPFFVKKEHRYRFCAYALDCLLNISANSI